MIMPNFLILGAQKAGTTALYHYLNQHPQIYMSPTKEPGFFDFEGQEPDFCGPRDKALYAQVTTDLEAYSHLFAGATNEIAIGEATTWYLYSPKAPERIHHYIPDAKLIVVLRNPVERAYSSFMHGIRDERETLDFAQALEAETERIEQNWEYLWRYRDMGRYYAQLKRYFSYFKSEQLKIYLYEDLNNHPAAVLTDIWQFLGVDANFIPEVFTRINISGTRKNQMLDAVLRNKHPVKQFLKPLLPKKMRQNLANHLRTKNFVKPQCPLELQQQLIAEFREEIILLQDLIQRDLSNWLKPNLGG